MKTAVSNIKRQLLSFIKSILNSKFNVVLGYDEASASSATKQAVIELVEMAIRIN